LHTAGTTVNKISVLRKYRNGKWLYNLAAKITDAVKNFVCFCLHRNLISIRLASTASGGMMKEDGEGKQPGL